LGLFIVLFFVYKAISDLKSNIKLKICRETDNRNLKTNNFG